MVLGCADSGTSNEISAKELDARIFSLERDMVELSKCIQNMQISATHSHEIFTGYGDFQGVVLKGNLNGTQGTTLSYFADGGTQCQKLLNKIYDRLGK